MRMSKDALLNRLGLVFLNIVWMATTVSGATYRTPNFVVSAPTQELAEKCGKTAEYYRKYLAEQWLGKEMPRWYKPCQVTVKVGQIGAGGATTFAFDRGEVFGWRMNVQGSEERVLDSVIPHEVSHTIFASHFRRPLPRWADEGAATLIEHESERNRQAMLLKQVWRTSRRIPLQKLLSIKEYPRDMQDVLTLYAEGYSLADFLVQAGGKERFLEFLETSHRQGWDRAIAQHYSLESVDDLEQRWHNWVMAGSPKLNIPEGSQVASNETSTATNRRTQNDNFERPVIRGQSPEPKPVPPETNAVAASQPNPSPERKVAMPLPRTTDVREESPGWRQQREQLKEIPKDFVNPANDPTRIAATSVRRTTEVESTEQPASPQMEPATNTQPMNIAPKSSPAPSSDVPAFRFELDGPSRTPGGQVSGPGRTPNWSNFPRS